MCFLWKHVNHDLGPFSFLGGHTPCEACLTVYLVGGKTYKKQKIKTHKKAQTIQKKTKTQKIQQKNNNSNKNTKKGGGETRKKLRGLPLVLGPAPALGAAAAADGAGHRGAERGAERLPGRKASFGPFGIFSALLGF